MNVENMLKLADAIENADKSQFHLGSWFGEIVGEDQVWESTSFYRGRIGDLFSQFPNEMKCGTTACIAGWAAALKYNFDQKAYTEDSVEDIAIDYLEITQWQARKLFFGNSDSVWAEHQEEYGYRVVGKEIEDDDTPYWYDLDPDEWNVTNKDAAHMLRRIAKGEVKL